ncbi:17475_t:CDS:2, partial [Dentiscutata erythropus]
DDDYIGKAPIEICEIMPFIHIPICLQAKDLIQFVGVFMALVVTSAGISAGSSTFGYEKVVYWRDTSAGMRTIPYFLAKIIANIPRLIIAALVFSLAFIIFYSNRASFLQIYIIVLIIYINAWAMGYFISVIVPKEKISLFGIGFALAWAPRWAIEAFYLKELEPRPWDEIKTEPLRHTYSFDNYTQCLLNILSIALGWAVLAFFAI